MAAGADGLIYRIEGTEPWFADRGPAAKARAYLLAGSDPVTADEVKERLIAHARAAGELERMRLDAAVDAGVTIVDALREVPLFASRRVLVIHRAEKLSNEKLFPGLADRLAGLDDATLVILMSGESGKELKKAFYAPFVKKRTAACFYAPASEKEAAEWLRQHCVRRRLRIGPNEAARVVAIVGLDPAELAQEIAKITFAAGPDITAAAITEHLEPHRQWTGFEWADAVLGRKRGAIAMAARASDHGREVVAVISALNWRLTSIEQVRRGEFLPLLAKRCAEQHAGVWPANRIAAARRILLRLNRDVIALPGAAHLARLELATYRLLALR